MGTETEVNWTTIVKDEDITIEEHDLDLTLTRDVKDEHEESPVWDQNEDCKTVHVCRYCEFKTKYRGNLSQHLNAKHLGKVELCQFCGKEFKDRSNLNRHIRVGHRGMRTLQKSLQKLPIHNCIYCDFSTTRKENLQTHINSLHTLEKVFQCSLCDYVGTRIDSYRKHMQAMHQHKIIPYRCTRCDFETTRRDFLNSHFDKNHLEFKVYSCKFCHYRASYSCNLKRHMQRKHS